MSCDRACPNLREAIAALVLGQLDGQTAEKLRRHIDRCEGCRGLYEVMMNEEQVIRSAFAAIANKGKNVEAALVQRMAGRHIGGRVAWLGWWRSRVALQIAAVAAVLIIIVSIVTVEMLSRNEPVTGEPGLAAGNKGTIPDENMQIKQTDLRLEQELQQVKQMFAAKDTAGLLQMLDKGQWKTKIAAANFLGQIGDAGAAKSLQKYAAQWTGSAQENPFLSAIDQINRRIAGIKSQERPPAQAVQESARQAQTDSGKIITPQPKPQYVLCGHITDAITGEPVTDAKLEMYISRIYTTKTDANGFYIFDKIDKDGNYRIRIDSTDYIGITNYDLMPIVELKRGVQVVRDFQLHRACQIEVKVVDEQEKPIKGARFILSSLADEMGKDVGERDYARRTDANGVMLIGGLAPSDSSYLVTVVHEADGPVIDLGNGRKRQETRWDYAAGHLIVTLKDPNVIETGRVVLRKGVEVKGYCEYADGVPAAGLSVSAHPQWWHCTSYPPIMAIDPNGYFTLPQIVPGRYSLHIHIPRGESGGVSFVVGQMEWPSQDEMIYVRVPQKSPGSLASISGRIIYVGGKKPSSVEVVASATGVYQSVNLWSGEENFTINSLEPGTYTLRFSGQEIQEKTIENVQAPSSGLEVELVYDENTKPVLQGVVVRADTREPVTRFKARARKLQTLRGPNYVQTERWAEFVNPQGRFNIEMVGPGVYHVQVAVDGFAWVWSEQVNTDENHPVTITLTSGGSITGKVLNEQGQPVVGAMVIPLSKAGGTMPNVKNVFVSTDGLVKTDANGVFVLQNLAAGSESIKVIHNQYCFSIRKDIPVAEGRTTEGVQVVLSKGGIVEGYVWDTQGKPEPSVTLLLQDASGYSGGGDEQAGRFATVVTDANGFYHVDHLPEQMCHIRRSNSWTSLGVVRRCVVPQNGMVSRVDFGGSPVIDGQLVLEGRSLSNVRVLLGDVSSPHFGIYQCYAMTNSEGLFRFVGVPAGRYAIYYEVPDKRNEWTKVAGIETFGQNMDVGAVPKQGARVRIYVKSEQAGGQAKPTQVYLQEGTVFGQQAGKAEKPTSPEEPYLISNVLPGAYTVTALLSGNVMIRQPIEVTGDQQDVEVTLTIPAGTATVSGRFIGVSQQPFVLWSSDEKIIAHVVYANAGEVYKVENLPAGRYMIGNYFITNAAPFVTFDLAEGESKTIDIDPSKLPAVRIGTLVIQIVGSDGTPITASQVWLEGQGQKITPTTSSSEGCMFIAPIGIYTLHVEGPGHRPSITNVQVEQTELSQGQLDRTRILVRLQRQ